MGKIDDYPEFRGLLDTIICYLNIGSYGDEYIYYLKDVMSPYDSSSGSFLQIKTIYHGMRSIVAMCGIPCMFSDLGRQTTVPFKMIKAIMPDPYHELTKFWKQNKDL